jgi:uncharacterized lipoprotein NlpE involved in copper resistance
MTRMSANRCTGEPRAAPRPRPVQQASAGWTAQAAAVTEPEAPARNEARPIVADPHEARLVLVARDEAFGERPSSFAARATWACEAAQLVAAGTPTLDPTARGRAIIRAKSNA